MDLKTSRRMLNRLIAFVVIIAGSATAQTPWVWQSVNLQGMGYVTGLVAHPDTAAAADLIYIRTDVGGAFRWDQAGGEWIDLFDNLSVLQGRQRNVESIAIDPKKPNRIYAATATNVLYGEAERGDIFISDDRGETWFSTGFLAKSVYTGANDFYRGSSGERLMVDPRNSNALYFGSRKNGLWLKKGAADWVAVGGGLPASPADPGFTFVIFDTTVAAVGGFSGTIYTGVYGSGVWRSIDAGATWTRIGTDVDPLRAAIGSDGILYVSFGGKEDSYGGPGAVRKYVAGVWTDITPHGVYSRSYSGIAVDPGNASHILVQTNQAEMHRSTDRGQNWTDVPMNYTWYPSYYWNADWYAWGTAALVIDPNDPTGNTAYTTNGFGVGMSANVFGASPTWRARMKNLEEYCAIAVKAPPVAGGARFFTGQWDGIGHRVVHPDSIPAQRFAFPQNRAVSKATSIDYCQAQPSCIAWVGYDQTNSSTLSGFSADNGSTWRPLRSHQPGKGGVIAFAANTPARIVWYPDNGGNGPMYSTDTGATWQACTGLPATEWYRGWNGQTMVSDRVNGQKFYMLHDDGSGTISFYRSIDGGAVWSKTAASFANAAGWCLNATVKTNPVKEGDIWVALHPNDNITASTLTTQFKFWHSTDGGGTFVAVAGVQAAFAVTMGKGLSAVNPALYLYGMANNDNAEAFYQSTNLGATWIRISDPQSERFAGVVAMDGDLLRDNTLYVARGGCRGFMYGTPTQTSLTQPGVMRTGSRTDKLTQRYRVAFVEHGNKKPLVGRMFDTYGRILTMKSKNSRCPDGIVIYAR